PKTSNRDTIKDFNGRYDTIRLDSRDFKKLGKKGDWTHPAKLKKSYFEVGSKADDRNDYIVYDRKTGKLSYDSDGSGSHKAVEIATLTKRPKLAFDDFDIV